MKFGGETSKKVHNVQKVFIKTTLYVLLYIVEFFVFVLDEIDVQSLKLAYKHIRVGNVQSKVPSDHQMVLEEGPFI